MSTILQVKRLRVPKDQRCDVTELLVEGDRTGAAELSGFCYCCWVLEKGVAARSSVLAWRMPWTEEPDGL